MSSQPRVAAHILAAIQGKLTPQVRAQAPHVQAAVQSLVLQAKPVRPVQGAGIAELPDSVVLRPIHSVDGMTAEAVMMDRKLLDSVTARLLAIPGVCAVFYDLTNKPLLHLPNSLLLALKSTEIPPLALLVLFC